MINSKNYTFLLIPYLTICCSLYQLTYWAHFGLNGLSLISLQDIIKSSVHPLIITAFGGLVGVYLSHIFLRKITKPINENASARTSSKKKFLPIVLLFIVSVVAIYLVYLFLPNQRYYIIAFMIANFFYMVVNLDKVFDNTFNTYFDKSMTFMVMLYFPAFSIATAVQDADTILNNKSYKYSINASTIAPTNILIRDTIKFIGLTDDNFIFTDLRNSKIIFLKKDSITLYTK